MFMPLTKPIFSSPPYNAIRVDQTHLPLKNINLQNWSQHLEKALNFNYSCEAI
jgi:hypothetical protein